MEIQSLDPRPSACGCQTSVIVNFVWVEAQRFFWNNERTHAFWWSCSRDFVPGFEKEQRCCSFSGSKSLFVLQLQLTAMLMLVLLVSWSTKTNSAKVSPRHSHGGRTTKDGWSNVLNQHRLNFHEKEQQN